MLQVGATGIKIEEEEEQMQPCNSNLELGNHLS
jgi:hypothetical protein